MIPFTKAHACGNDFLIVAEDAAAGMDWADVARRLCTRNTGVGADGVEFFAWTGPRSGRIRLHNADGSVAEISGNGTRCVAAWMAEQLGSNPGDELQILTDAGERTCRIENRDGHRVEVTARMGVPILETMTLVLPEGAAQASRHWRVPGFRWPQDSEASIDGIFVSMGNPHFVIEVGDAGFRWDHRSWSTIGGEICVHRDFPNQTNVEFFCVADQNEIEIRIWERGVGPTSSSGTGSSAAAVAAIAKGMVRSPIRVVAPGGPQTVAWNGPGTELQLTGPAALIARGEAW